jgi:hypothetical protein
LTHTLRRISSVALLVATITLIVVGPQWPGRATSLMCGESVETITEKSLLPDMDACAVAMSQAAESGTHCFCSVKENRFAPPYYLALVPIVFVAATWIFSAAIARGMAAVVFVLSTTLLIPGPLVFRMYSAGVRIPNLLAMMAIGWPQLVFFGPTIFWAEPRSGLVLPHQWALLVTLAFWLVAAFAFGLLARRMSSPAVLLISAVGFVAGTAVAVRVVAPLFNWHMVMESL